MNVPRRPLRPRPKIQRGVTLLESLVAIVILAVAVLSMLVVQLRTLAETQTSVRRAQAVRLIEDLAERIKSNPGGYAQLASYTADWSTSPAVATNCTTTVCSAAALATWDINEWKESVNQRLPSGQAYVFPSTTEGTGLPVRQLGVMVAWRANERDTIDAAYTAAFTPTGSAQGVNCPTGLICHLTYVQP